MKVIAFVGMPGAGKSSCVDYMTKKGLPKVYMGGVVVDETIRRFGAATQDKERIVREELRAKEGMGAIAKRIIPKITELLKTSKYVVADGIYSWAEYRIFKDTFKEDVLVIAITAPRATRHARLANRPVRPLTAEEAQTRDYAEIEFMEKGGPIANADYTINNDGSTETLYADLETVLKKANFYTS